MSETSSTPVIEMVGVTKDYESQSHGAQVVTHVLKGIDLRLAPGELVALTGPSGSGKSTLLTLLGLLDGPSSGQIRLLGIDVVGLDDDNMTRLRGQSIGFVFQFHHLLTGFTAAENVMMPMIATRGKIEPDMHPRAVKLLSAVGLADFSERYVTQISGGQQQRVAVARALALSPALVLADEPTGNLDTQSAQEVLTLLRTFNREAGTTFLIATHDPGIAAQCDRTIHLVDGRRCR